MPVDPQPYALTTVDALLGYMNEPADLTGKQRDRAQRLINSYSAAINSYLKRQLKPLEAATDKVFVYPGNGYLSLAPWEATAIYIVTLYTDRAEAEWVQLANQTATQAAGWRANPRNKSAEGTYWSLTLPELGRYHPLADLTPWPVLDNFEFQVTVNADWGVDQADIPDDVELACWLACANAWTNPGGNATRRLGPLQTSDFEAYVPGTEDGLSLPRAARALLSPHRRRSTGIR